MDWKQFRATKTYDLLCATPNILWLLNGVRRQWPVLVTDLRAMIVGTAAATDVLQFVSVLASAALYATLIYFSIVRITPAARSRGLLPRLTAVAGGFVTTGLLYLPAAHLPLSLQVLSAALIFGGCLGAVLVLQNLGRSFSILPEARKLVTSGPYAVVRHPLYTVEVIAVLGTALQFQQPWALLIWTLCVVLQYARSRYEERVLEDQYPEYAEYQARTWRFIPGVF